jgi:hypothetical protein
VRSACSAGGRAFARGRGARVAVRVGLATGGSSNPGHPFGGGRRTAQVGGPAVSDRRARRLPARSAVDVRGLRDATPTARAEVLRDAY